MKQAFIDRKPSTTEGIFGALITSDGALILKSLELQWVDEDKNGLGDPMRSCVTPGTYIMKWQKSPKYGWCYEITGVVGRDRILLHSANFAGDTKKGLQSDLLGCVALGYAIGALINKFGKAQKALVRDPQGRGSRSAVEAFNAWGAEEDIELTIRGSKT